MQKASLSALEKKRARLEDQAKAISALIKQAQEEQEQRRQVLIGNTFILLKIGFFY
jgi:hypothetical protein